MADVNLNMLPTADITVDISDPTNYDTGINALRLHFATHRAGAVTVAVNNGTDSICLVFINCSNLYIEAFHATGNWRHFKDAVLTPTASVALPIGGAHRDLGTPKIGSFSAGFQWMLGAITSYAGAPIGADDDIKKCLSFLVIAISEATRFETIKTAVTANIDYSEDYDPKDDCANKMTNWSTLTGQNDADVQVPYIES